MKKLISLILSLCLIFTLALPALAVSPLNPDYNVPTITIRGDGTDIYDSTGTEVVWPVSFGDDEGDMDTLVNSVLDVIFPHLVTGLITGNYDGYYEAFYQAMLPLFEDAHLDKNGEASNGTIIDPEDTADNQESMIYDKKYWYGDDRYGMGDYTFHYDWRLSPLELVSEFDAFIKGVMKITKAKKVNLVGVCLGGCTLMAYLDFYLDELEKGVTPYIKNVFFDATVVNDCDAFTDVFTGNITLDADALQRFLDEYVDKDEMSFEGLADSVPFLNEIIFTSYELLKETHVVTGLFDSVEDFYKTIYVGLVPKLAIASYATFPGYWASVQAEYYEQARSFVFGEPGDERYEEYKGLIAKNDAYHEKVGSRIDDIILECQDKADIHFGALAKYGRQLYPFIKSQNELADNLVTLESASFGATTCLVGETLSDDYIASRIELGYGDYISADKQVDLSTSLLKDTTWIIKNSSHYNFKDEQAVVNNFLWSTNLTTNSEGAHPRFMLFDPETETLSELTVENNVDFWEDSPITEEESTIWTKLAALMRWLTAMFKFILHISNTNPGPAPV